MSTFLTDLLYESLIQNEYFDQVLSLRPILVPIPLISQKFKKRGYNQSEILVKKLAKKFDLSVLDCLQRVKETRSQVGLDKKERRENIKGAYEFKPKFADQIKGKAVIVIDDVLTSGATMSEATSVLKRAGADKVWALAFAKED